MSLELLGNSYPAEWTESFLPEICNPKQWKTISTSELTDTGYVVYGANGKIGFFSTYTHEKPTLMITCRGATCGNLHISVPYSYINGNAMALDELPENLVTQKYLFYALKARGLDDAISGSAQPQITRQGLSIVNLRIAPLAEQKEIARKLDELLAQVDSIKTRLDAIPNILKRFRQSVLAAAVGGRLTEEWRGENDISKWKIKKISELTIKVGSGSTPKGGESSYKETGIPLIRSMNVIFFGFKYKGLAYIDENQAHELRGVEVFANDVLLNITGASIGRVTLAPKELAGARVNQHVCIVRPNADLLNKYLCFYFSSPELQEIIGGENYGVTRQALTKQQILDFEIPLPGIKEQTEIVRRVEQLFAYADQIEQRVKDAQARVNHLTQSILAKAFRGELTAEWRAQNVELISGENSAAALLERIKAERETSTKAKKKKA